METNRGHASRQLTLLIVIIAIAFTVAAYLTSLSGQNTEQEKPYPVFYKVEIAR